MQTKDNVIRYFKDVISERHRYSKMFLFWSWIGVFVLKVLLSRKTRLSMENMTKQGIAYLVLYFSIFKLTAVALSLTANEISAITSANGSTLFLAFLQRDPHANLTASFTICSTARAATLTYPYGLVFFALGNTYFGQPFPVEKYFVSVQETSEGISTQYDFSKALGSTTQVAHVFSHKWVKSCVAFNQNLSQIQWVVDGAFVKNKTFSKSHPLWMTTDLTGKLIVGGTTDDKVTNVNVFSTALSVEVMEQNTQAGTCSEEGDYLAWRDMNWTTMIG